MTQPASHDPATTERPDPALWRYTVLVSLLFGPFFFIPLFFGWLHFRTLRYRFDDEGVGMRWGALFRREVDLTYERIQDIHLVSNPLERRLGLARIKIQTASGSSKAEMTLEGIKEFEEMRDFLYSKMRGQRPEVEPAPDSQEAIVAELSRATAELQGIRRLLGGEPEGRPLD